MASLSLFSPSSWSSITGHTIRCISLPARSHNTHQVEEELTNLKTWESSMSRIPDAQTFSSGLACLERLYTCADNILSLPLAQHSFSNYQHEKIIVDELLVRSMRLLDSCGTIGNVVSQVKAHVRDIRSAQRRQKEDLCIDASILKKLNKEARKAVGELKLIDQLYASKPINLEHHLSSVIRILRDVSEVSISVFGLLLTFLSLSITKLNLTSKWSTFLKLIQNESAGSKYPSQVCVETMDSHVEGIEIGLTSMFRNLIKTRSSILNIKSHYYVNLVTYSTYCTIHKIKENYTIKDAYTNIFEYVIESLINLHVIHSGLKLQTTYRLWYRTQQDNDLPEDGIGNLY